MPYDPQDVFVLGGNVCVSGDADNPLPITGNISVSPSANQTVVVTNGTVNANITGGNVTAAIQSVPANMSVAVSTVPANQTVNVTNTPNVAVTSVPANQTVVVNSMPANITANITATVANQTVQVTNTPNVAVTSVPANQTVNVTTFPANITANVTATVANQTVVVNGNASVVGPVAGNATVAGNPVQVAYRALSAEPAPVYGNNTVGQPSMSIEGKAINLPYANKENMLRGTATVSNITAANITGMSAQGANQKIYITSAQAYRTDAGNTTVFLTLNDTANTTIPLAPNNGYGPIYYPIPLVLAANVSANVTLSANITSAKLSVQGYFGT